MPSQLMQEFARRIQGDAQANVPVIPNNGNPQGANNMPTQPTIPQPPGNAWGSRYSWLAPSPSMAMVNQMLAQPIMQPQPPRMGFDDGPVAAPVPTVPAPNVLPTPVLPIGTPGKALGDPRMGFGDGAVLPRQRGQLLQQARQGDMPVVPRGLGYNNFMKR